MTDFPETVPFDRALTATPDELPGALPDTPNTYPVHIRFTGSGSEYFGIWIVNLLLMLVTLGLYYPWAKVRRLRYFYGSTSLDGSSFEYHGLSLIHI